MIRLTFSLLAFAAAGIAAPVPKSVRGVPNKLDGTWEIVELWSGMNDVTSLNPWVWEIRGEQLTIFVRQKDGTLKLHDPNMTTTLVRPKNGEPTDVDYVRDDGKSPMLFKGNVVVDGERLVLSFDSPGKPRPTERKPSRAGWHYVFERKPEK